MKNYERFIGPGGKKSQRIRCYDNGGATADRYTVAYIDQPTKRGMVEMVGMSAEPFHPQGVGQHSEGQCGKHLGKRIKFATMPLDCRMLVQQDLF